MDPELRAFLEAMEERIEQRAATRDAETRQVLGAEIKATRAVAEAALQVAVTARDAATAAREEAAAARDAATAAREEAAAARDAAAGARKEVATTSGSLEAKIDEVRRQAGINREAIIAEIRALPEGLSTFQHQEADRLDAAREEAMLNGHVLPLEASATAFAEHLARHDNEIKAIQDR